MTAADGAGGLAPPSVSVVIPNLNGANLLPACLDSLQKLDYEPDLLDVVVVDNASTDGSLELLRASYPWVRVLEQPTNLGFAEGVNIAARSASSECVAFVNNDMRVDPSWLRELVSLYDPASGYVCIAGVILDWDGRRVDFVDGSVNFHGFGAQEWFGAPVETVPIIDGRDLLFACGGSMLMSRELFIDLGGFDPSYFAFFEDVDLGWRLWLSGYKVRLAANARCFHRHHATASSLPEHQLAFLYERNALTTLFKNAEDRLLAPLLSVSLFMLAERALTGTGSSAKAFLPGTQSDATERVARLALAPLHAVHDVLGRLDELLEQRKRIQRLRRRSDREILPLFGRPFMAPRDDPHYLQAAATLARVFGLVEAFKARRATRLLVVGAADRARSLQIARLASGFVRVVHAVPERAEQTPGIETVVVDRPERLDELAAEADAVLVAVDAPEAERLAEGPRGPLIVDLGEANGTPPPNGRVVDAADLLLCATDAAREKWQATLASHALPRIEAAPTADPDDPLRPVRQLIEEPWRTGRGLDSTATEDLQRVLEIWRLRYGVSRSRWWHLGRALWRFLPENARAFVRRKLQRR